MESWYMKYMDVLLSHDALYITSLLVTAAVGPLFRRLPSAALRRWCGSLLGLLLLLLLCRADVVHPVACALGNALLLKIVPLRYVHLASFGWSFGYLALVRYIDAFVRPVSPLVNIVQMMSALRLVGMAFEVHTSWRLRKSADVTDDVTAQLAWSEVAPSAGDLLHYMFFYVAIVTGPYITFATYRHSIEGTFWRWADCSGPAWRRARLLPFYALMFIIIGHFWPIEFVNTPEMEERSFFYRLAYIYPVFAHFRMRMYIGFILSEVACITHGVGAYPSETGIRPGAGPTKYKPAVEIMRDPTRLAAAQYDFEAVHNIFEGRTELDTSMTAVLKQWNTTVQYWLYTVVYKGTPGTKLVRASVTMLVSAFWHGIQSGYYLSLLSCPPYMVVEDVWVRLVRRRLSAERVWLYDCVSWFLRVSMFSYLSMGFRLLDASSTLAYWSSVYHVGHLLPVVMYLVGMVALRAMPKPRAAAAAAAGGGGDRPHKE